MNNLDCKLIPLEIRKYDSGERFFYRLDTKENFPLSYANALISPAVLLEEGDNYTLRENGKFMNLGTLPEGTNAIVLGEPFHSHNKKFLPASFYQVKKED